MDIVFLWALSNELSYIFFIYFLFCYHNFMLPSGWLVLHWMKHNKNKWRLFPYVPPGDLLGRGNIFKIRVEMWSESYQNFQFCMSFFSPPYFWLVSFVFVISLHSYFEKKLLSSKIEFDSDLRKILCCFHTMVLDRWVKLDINKRLLKSWFFEK